MIIKKLRFEKPNALALRKRNLTPRQFDNYIGKI
jgi:hypothetical protein